MTALNKQALIAKIKKQTESFDTVVLKEDEANALLGELEAAEKRIEEEICRANREHHRGFMMACNHLKEHANVHYADAAEMEIAALRQRIAELEAREVKLPPTFWYEHDDLPREIPVLSRRLLLKALREAGVKFAAGIGVKRE